MADINLTALGMSGSGKTCFLVAMYYAMSAGVNGYTLSMADAEDDYELRTKWKNMSELTGETRFPQGTDKNGDYLFDLEYAYQTIKSFHWMDYRCRTDFADIQNKKECGGNRQWQNHYLRNWAANTKGKGII